eukprot:1190657-Prorocentrum_minimum.AAC.3
MPRKVDFGGQEAASKEALESSSKADDASRTSSGPPDASQTERPASAREYKSDRLTSILERRPGTACLASRPAKWGTERIVHLSRDYPTRDWIPASCKGQLPLYTTPPLTAPPKPVNMEGLASHLVQNTRQLSHNSPGNFTERCERRRAPLLSGGRGEP